MMDWPLQLHNQLSNIQGREVPGLPAPCGGGWAEALLQAALCILSLGPSWQDMRSLSGTVLMAQGGSRGLVGVSGAS